MPDEEYQKLSPEEQNAQWDRELASMTEEDWDRFYFNCTGRKHGDPIPPKDLVDSDEFFENPDAFLQMFPVEAWSFLACNEVTRIRYED